MNRLILTAAALLAAAQVSAGVRIETVFRDIQTKTVDGGADVDLIQDGMLRSDHAKSPNTTTIIKDATIYVLDGEKKTYYVVDEAAKKKLANEAAAEVKQMQERVKNMPPEQRARMEASMGRHMPAVFGKKHNYELKDTGNSDTFEGRECHLWNLHKNGVLENEFCVVPYASLPGKEDFAKAFREFWDAFGALTAGLMSSEDYAKVRQSIDGYPVRIRSFDDAGQLRATELVLTKWVEEPLPASTFGIPAGYKKIAPPKAGE